VENRFNTKRLREDASKFFQKKSKIEVVPTVPPVDPVLFVPQVPPVDPVLFVPQVPPVDPVLFDPQVPLVDPVLFDPQVPPVEPVLFDPQVPPVERVAAASIQNLEVSMKEATDERREMLSLLKEIKQKVDVKEQNPSDKPSKADHVSASKKSSGLYFLTV
jgi:hypothetical protein